jgi:hypothetical protein
LTSVRDARIPHIAAHGITTSSGRAIVLADGNLTAATSSTPGSIRGSSC